MNIKTRKEISTIIDELDDILFHVNCIKDDEEKKLDNMPESLQDSERGEQMQEGIDTLESAYDSISDAIDYLQELVNQ